MALAILLLLIVVNGVLVSAEMSLVSARRGVLQRRAEDGDEGAQAALRLMDSPNEFLATVQIGVTLISTAAGAFGGATLADGLASWLSSLRVPMLASHAHAIAVILVVAGIAYLSLVIGELVPKRLALRDPDALAGRVARPMRAISRAVLPLVKLLGASTDLVLRLFGPGEGGRPLATSEEIGYLLETGTRRGEIEPVEAELVGEVFRFTETQARAIMVPRPNIFALPDTTSPEELLEETITAGYARIPIYHESIDTIIGVIHARDLLGVVARHEPYQMSELLRQPLFVPETITVSDLLGLFRKARTYLAIVLDEYGATAGLVTLEDVLEELVGEIGPEHREEESPVVRRSENSWLVEGTISLDDLRDTVPIKEWPERDRLGYTTLAGFILARLGRIPRPGESTDWQAYRFEVVDLDQRRIDAVLVTRLPEAESGSAQAREEEGGCRT